MNQNTHRETFDEYRRRVLGYLGDRDPIEILETTPERLEESLRGLQNGILIRRPEPDKWSICEIAGHLADAELAFAWRLRSMLATPGGQLAWWDEDLWAKKLFYEKRSLKCALLLFRALREANLELLKLFPRGEWKESFGVHDVRGRQTVEDFVLMEAAHDLNHLLQIDNLIY